MSLLLYVLTLEPLLCSVRDEKANPALCGVLFDSYVTVKISMSADNITIFVSGPLDILSMKKAVERYKEVAGNKINFDKSNTKRLRNCFHCLFIFFVYLFR